MRVSKKLRSVVTALAVVVGAFAAAAGPGAPASHAATRDGGTNWTALVGIEIVKKTGQINQFSQQTVYCPSGKVAIGGGGEASTGYPARRGHELSLVGSFPMGSGTQAFGWASNARWDWASQTPLTVTTYAICAYMPTGYEVVGGAPTQVPSGQTIAMTCPAGKVAIGGGGEVRGPNTGLSKSYPAAASGSAQMNQWVVGGFDMASSTTNTTAYAICSAPVPDLTIARYNAASESPLGGLLKCPTGKIVSGGGASGSGPRASLVASRPAKAAETGSNDGWWVQATDDLSTSDIDLYVMCVNR
ncbi:MULTISPECIES: hypothetical protein [Kitasatospora]|uniref:Uncharacterized protein n=1 Tax=Kitasatospora setae (strain ATCC 33774 / DSM 43861 / JCM 3304 / KCC A-0304 / NBRC 14216 / KM-6054) TaxID=452652 RepID=E4NG66_KITSK|nr:MULTISPECIES: hypothetical protein [Kitasatospora]BAJ30496.1 hypothetical protein KSE_47160 [Kitasatospora setae KM-6054]